MEKVEILNKSIVDFSKKIDIIQTIILFLIALLVPTFLGGVLDNVFGEASVIATNSQLIIGSIVNSALVIAALNVKGVQKIVGLITMPSISTILSGYVFKTASVYMVYMIPAIWIGNFALVYIYKLLVVNKKRNYWLTGVIGITTKVAIIFGLFSILRLLNIFPNKLAAILQVNMGITQAITATIGTGISYIVYKISNLREANNIQGGEKNGF